jgi:hypothetical protein
MNNGKRGAQYHYPDSFIQLLGVVLANIGDNLAYKDGEK